MESKFNTSIPEEAKSESQNFEREPLVFYDIIIKVQNLLSLLNIRRGKPENQENEQGWPIFYRNKDFYKKLECQEGPCLAVVGAFKKGKTFLLGEISGDNKIPAGQCAVTEGLSIKWFQKDNCAPVIALDTAGASVPIDVTGLPQDTDSEEYRIAFLERLRDHKACEDMLHRFALEASKVVVVVVNQLTYEDQRLVSKLKVAFRNTKTKLIVVHNLFLCETVAEVLNKISTSIEKAFSLHLKIYGSEITQNKNNHYYVEKLGADNVIHLIYAKKGSEAGNFYNDVSLEQIHNILYTVEQQKLNIFSKLTDFIQKNILRYISMNSKYSKVKLVNDESGLPLKVLAVDSPNEFHFNSQSADEIGFVSTLNLPTGDFIIENEEEKKFYLILVIECPSFDEESFDYEIDRTNFEFKIRILGKKNVLTYLDLTNREDPTKLWGIEKKIENFRNDKRVEGEFEIATRHFSRNKIEIVLVDGNPVVARRYQNGVLILSFEIMIKENYAIYGLESIK